MKSNELMNNELYMNMINQNVAYIKKVAKEKSIDTSIYEIAIVLGSGLSHVINDMNVHFEIKYKDMPFMPVSTVKGHESRLVFGNFNGKNVIVMDGRFHYYEGYHLREVTMPVRIFKKLGINKIILTNAAGASNSEYKVGDIMIFKDHVNLTGLNPLIGQNLDEFGERFIPINGTYDEKLIEEIYSKAKEKDINIHKGVFMWFTGPSYETTAEVDIMRKLGVDARAMSTVPEIIVAAHSGMKVVAFSCITNVTLSNEKDDHNSVVENAKIGSKNMKEVLKIAAEVI
mgnify:FL=1